MVMWVCEAWEVNIWTVFAVRPNGPNNNNNKKNNNNFASSRSDPPQGSDKNKSCMLIVPSLYIFEFSILV